VRGQEGKVREKMESTISVLDVGGTAPDKRLQNTVLEIRDMFSGTRASRHSSRF
jgi:hypothetical protein